MSNITNLHFPPDRTLPDALVLSDKFKQLTIEQLDNFRGRLKYIEELTRKVNGWTEETEDDEFRELLDDIELDLAVNQAAPRGESVVSAWSIHTSWTFGTSPMQLRASLSPAALHALDMSAPDSVCSATELLCWVKDQSIAVMESLDRLYAAPTYLDVIAQLVAINILVANMLLGVCRSRLNPNLPR